MLLNEYTWSPSTYTKQSSLVMLISYKTSVGGSKHKTIVLTVSMEGYIQLGAVWGQPGWALLEVTISHKVEIISVADIWDLIGSIMISVCQWSPVKR